MQKSKAKKYPFYRKYPNGFLNFMGCYPLDELNEDRVLRKFRILSVKYNLHQWFWSIEKLKLRVPVFIIVPKKESLKWREDFRAINKPLSANYIY